MARLHGILRLEEVTDDLGQTLMRDGRVVWRLLDPLYWMADSGDTSPMITVPAGFETDLASIPRLARGLIPSSGPWQRAAVIHDWLYATQGSWGLAPPHFKLTRAQADNVFRDAMAAAGVNWITRQAMWTAVRIGGWKGWGR
jgi:hypothetical protein